MYAVRRYLGFSWDEWTALPWWQSRAYREMLEEAQPWARESEAISPEARKRNQAANAVGAQLDATATAEDMVRHGVRVENS